MDNGWLSSFYSCLIKKYDKTKNIESKFAELERLPGDLNS
jgi:anaphase-promoting complex subunit 6